jgi:hypothetical protein
MIYRIRDEHANHYTTDAVDLFLYRGINCNTESCNDPLDKTCLQIKFQNSHSDYFEILFVDML